MIDSARDLRNALLYDLARVPGCAVIAVDLEYLNSYIYSFLYCFKFPSLFSAACHMGPINTYLELNSYVTEQLGE